ncbi:TetR/AcrR family transcriptional regulator [uncultured Abyssibacter sp.]|uniref:TetR/AcrR family transcriptional regulator n=1 Tax=uncultured Abyssibacter sp. TaxID=2320202 RepID=UPI0032B2F91F
MQAKPATELDPLAVARVPMQSRARARFEAVLAESEKLLEESGLQAFSIPTVAERLGMTRGSIYTYFPTPHAILNELAKRHLDELQALFNERAVDLAAMSWRDAIRTVVQYAVEFHNSRPAARMLILGGAVTDTSFRAQDMLMRHLGELGRRIWEKQDSPLPTSPDVSTLVADIGLTCFRRSFLDHGWITPEYQEAAVIAMQRYLEYYRAKK